MVPFWNAPAGGPAPDGYRMYRQQLSGGTWGPWEPRGNWDSDTTTPAPNFLTGTSMSDPVSCGVTYRYRVTAYRQASAPRDAGDPDATNPQGAESVVSTPAQSTPC